MWREKEKLPVPEVPDELVEKARAGDIKSIGEVIVITKDYMIRVITGKIATTNTKLFNYKGGVSEVLSRWQARILISINGFERRGCAKITTWMTTIANNIVYDLAREYKAERNTIIQFQGSGNPESGSTFDSRAWLEYMAGRNATWGDAITTEQREIIEGVQYIVEKFFHICNGLPEEGKRYILGRYVDKRMTKDIAAELGHTKGAGMRKTKEWRDRLIEPLSGDRLFIESLETVSLGKYTYIDGGNICSVILFIAKIIEAV